MRREILIDGICGEVRVALLEDGRLAEIVIERSDAPTVSGNIYKGRVNTILPGMQSAFLDIGIERDAFLYAEDAERPAGAAAEPMDGESAAGPEASADERLVARRRPQTRIEDVLKQGQELLVQVSRDPLGRKGARLTANISIPGRFLVYLPFVRHIGISRRIDDPAERERLRSIVATMAEQRGWSGGFIVRTAAAGAEAQPIGEDAQELTAAWSGILRLSDSRLAPALLKSETGAVSKVLRDLYREDVDRVVVEGARLFDEAVEAISRAGPMSPHRIVRHEGARPLFQERGLDAEIDRALRRRVWLPSGGSIVIDQTEALVAIDVNTGKYVGTSRFEETILKTNLEAVTEVVRQIRLRDLGGIIVVDFIDMGETDSKEQVIRSLEGEILKDRARSRMLDLSAFGLVEITRRRSRPSLGRLLGQACPVCDGAGTVKSARTLWLEIVRAVLSSRRSGETATVAAHPEACEALQEMAGACGEDESIPRLTFRADPDLALSEFRIEHSAGE